MVKCLEWTKQLCRDNQQWCKYRGARNKVDQWYTLIFNTLCRIICLQIVLLMGNGARRTREFAIDLTFMWSRSIVESLSIKVATTSILVISLDLKKEEEDCQYLPIKWTNKLLRIKLLFLLFKISRILLLNRMLMMDRNCHWIILNCNKMSLIIILIIMRMSTLTMTRITLIILWNLKGLVINKRNKLLITPNSLFNTMQWNKHRASTMVMNSKWPHRKEYKMSV